MKILKGLAVLIVVGCVAFLMLRAFGVAMPDFSGLIK